MWETQIEYLKIPITHCYPNFKIATKNLISISDRNELAECRPEDKDANSREHKRPSERKDDEDHRKKLHGEKHKPDKEYNENSANEGHKVIPFDSDPTFLPGSR